MQYKPIYSNRKTVGLSVKNGEIIVRAPYGINKHSLDKIVESHRKWIEAAIEREKSLTKRTEKLPVEKIEELKAAAKYYFSEKCKQYAAIMGVNYKKISITAAKTRFGSCSSKKHICFSYRLMLYPEEAREYVIVHELAHLTEMNHSPKFYSIVEKFMPDYKERKKLLK